MKNIARQYPLQPDKSPNPAVDEVRAWIDSLDQATFARVVQAIDALAEAGPGLGRPLVDTITGSSIANLKELRPGSGRVVIDRPSRSPNNATRST